MDIKNYNKLIEDLYSRSFNLPFAITNERKQILKEILLSMIIPEDYLSIIDMLLMDNANSMAGISYTCYEYQSVLDEITISINEMYGILSVSAIQFYDEKSVKPTAGLIDSFANMDNQYIKKNREYRSIKSFVEYLSDIHGLLIMRKDILVQLSVNKRAQ